MQNPPAALSQAWRPPSGAGPNASSSESKVVCRGVTGVDFSASRSGFVLMLACDPVRGEGVKEVIMSMMVGLELTTAYRRLNISDV